MVARTEPAPRSGFSRPKGKNPTVAMLLQLSPVLAVLAILVLPRAASILPVVLSPLLFAASIPGLGYVYLGRLRRFILAWSLCWLWLPAVFTLVALLLPATPAALALIFTAPLAALVVLAYLSLDARRLAIQFNASLPPEQAGGQELPAGALTRAQSPSRRTSLELSCAAEAAGYVLDEVGEPFWQSLRPDWLNASQSERPFDDESMNAVYREIAGLRQAALDAGHSGTAGNSVVPEVDQAGRE